MLNQYIDTEKFNEVLQKVRSFLSPPKGWKRPSEAHFQRQDKKAEEKVGLREN